MTDVPTKSGHGSDLPKEIESALLKILDGPEEQRTPRISQLCDQNPGHAAAIRAFPRIEVDDSREHPTRIGPYKILDQLGAGGMGIVYLAERKEPVRMQVALKVIKLGMDSEEVLARFDLERRALAAMQHECIAKVHDAGTTDRGQPYFVMELVKGLPITDYCNKHRLSLNDRLKLFQEVCHGVQHAHQKGVVHRDLKPGNILVARSGDHALPKIIDFGLARATNRDLLAQSFHTAIDHIIGTPEYMAPEQANLDSEGVDTRADVYSLGVILYELLAGELPFGRNELRSVGWLEIRRILAEDEPSKPSTKLSVHGQDSQHRASRLRMTSGALCKELRGDLDWIILKAMAKEPERRYDSPPALASDLQRYMDFEPVLAGPPSTIYRMKKFIRKYRGRVVSAAVVLVTALVGAGVSWSYQVEAQEKNDEFDMLANVARLQTAVASEHDLYPAWPKTILDLQAWLDGDVMTLHSSIPLVRSTVELMETRALPRTEAETALKFSEESEQFLHDTLQNLIRDYEEFVASEIHDAKERLAWAQRIEELTFDHPNATTTWEEAREAILEADGESASRLYSTGSPLELEPQMGLVPLGMNPDTLLWEFYHLRSAADPEQVPERDAEGRLPMLTGMGMVFVLVPGGSFLMGAQRGDKQEAKYDPRALNGEQPTHHVALSPFFLSKYELTQEQWQRLSGGKQPSVLKPGAPGTGNVITTLNPVEQVSWTDCVELMSKHRLLLPTEAQWEYACGAEATTAWFTGSEPRSLKGYANILDGTARAEVSEEESSGRIWFTDGHYLHASVGSFLPNKWGLFDMHGNVWEWCQDWHGPYTVPTGDGDGLRLVHEGTLDSRVYRGGGFLNTASKARTTSRGAKPPSSGLNNLGLRPARAIIN